MPIIQRYSNIKKGGIVFVGNTLGLSKFSNANTAGVLGSIGAFISLDQSLRVNDFPFGTTLDYTKNGSQALLSLPVGSSVIYAELVWGGLYRSSARDISSLLGNPVAFRTPQGAYSIQPDAATSQNFTIQNGTQTLGFYVRSANVTPLVAAALNGTYAAGQIPALIEAIDANSSDTNHAGWILAVGAFSLVGAEQSRRKLFCVADQSFGRHARHERHVRHTQCGRLVGGKYRCLSARLGCDGNRCIISSCGRSDEGCHTSDHGRRSVRRKHLRFAGRQQRCADRRDKER